MPARRVAAKKQPSSVGTARYFLERLVTFEESLQLQVVGC